MNTLKVVDHTCIDKLQFGSYDCMGGTFMPTFLCDELFDGERWHQGPTLLEVDRDGDIVSVEPADKEAPTPAQPLHGVVVPGIPNLHSHAHQRAMAGRSELAVSPDQENFWTWRQTMYACVLRIDPEQLQAIAAQLYLELLKGGYTSVTEFQYLHHNPDGAPYEDPAEMSLRCLEAAREVGIGMTCLPALYQYSDFDEREATPEQRRFVCRRDQFIHLFESLGPHCRVAERALGIAPHSLRAVSEDSLRYALEHSSGPVHLHISEQAQEVEACRTWSGQAPLPWLLDRFAVDSRWTLVHATHAEDRSLAELARRGAQLALCPTTEANLGDGIVNAKAFVDAGGCFGIGSDSQICRVAAQELRLLEYSQRLRFHRRNVLAARPHLGESLLVNALEGGERSSGRPIAKLAPGYRADFLVLDSQHPALVATEEALRLDAWIFAADTNPIKEVWVGGNARVLAGRHPQEEAIRRRYDAAMRRLWS